MKNIIFALLFISSLACGQDTKIPGKLTVTGATALGNTAVTGNFTAAGNTLFLSATATNIRSDSTFSFAPTTNASSAADTGLSRASAGVVAVGTGSPGSTAGSLSLTNIVMSGTLSTPASGAGTFYETNTYTPSITSTTGTLTSVTGISGRFTRIGRVVTMFFAFTITTNGTGATSLRVTTPFTTAGSAFGFARDTSSGGAVQVYNTSGSNTYVVLTLMANDLYPAADGVSFQGYAIFDI